MARLEKVFVFGAGKVGAGLARAMRRAGLAVTLRPQRRGLPARRIDADLVVLALRDRDLAACAAAIAQRGIVSSGKKRTPVVHCAGALGPEALAALREAGVPVAQMHPMISFASASRTPDLTRAHLHVDGDGAAVRAARALGRKLGMTPRTIAELDRVAYHAAAGLVANGAAALAAGGLELLARAGVDRIVAARMLGPLIRSVGDNVESLGLPAALTGPIRRGDAAGVARHLETIARLAPGLIDFYLAAGRLQVPLANALGEATPGALRDIDALLARAPR